MKNAGRALLGRSAKQAGNLEADKGMVTAVRLIKKVQKNTRGLLFLWLFCFTYRFGRSLNNREFFISECIKD